MLRHLTHFAFQGAFGIVVHCKKKSTGKHYAMKIQTKLGLLANYAPDYSGVSIEKEALAACIHPFIISMHYAFQTTNMVMIVMDLGTGMRIASIISSCSFSIIINTYM